MRAHARVCVRMCVVLQVLGQVLQVLGRMCIVIQVLSRSVVLQVLGRMCVVLVVLGLLQLLGRCWGWCCRCWCWGGAFSAHHCSPTHKTLFLPILGNPGASK